MQSRSSARKLAPADLFADFGDGDGVPTESRSAPGKPEPEQIFVEAGRHAGKAASLEPGVKAAIGRSSSCELCLRGAPGVSRRHAQVWFKDGQYVVTDLGSRNGTRVNGIEIAGDHPLQDGDLIELSDERIRFQGPRSAHALISAPAEADFDAQPTELLDKDPMNRPPREWPSEAGGGPSLPFEAPPPTAAPTLAARPKSAPTVPGAAGAEAELHQFLDAAPAVEGPSDEAAASEDDSPVLGQVSPEPASSPSFGTDLYRAVGPDVARAPARIKVSEFTASRPPPPELLTPEPSRVAAPPVPDASGPTGPAPAAVPSLESLLGPSADVPSDLASAKRKRGSVGLFALGGLVGVVLALSGAFGWDAAMNDGAMLDRLRLRFGATDAAAPSAGDTAGAANASAGAPAPPAPDPKPAGPMPTADKPHVVRATSNAHVVEVRVEVGDRVVPEQVVALVETGSKKVLRRLDLLRTRERDLFAGQKASGLAEIRSERARLRKKLKPQELRATVVGQVQAVHVEDGEMVKHKTPLVQIGPLVDEK